MSSSGSPEPSGGIRTMKTITLEELLAAGCHFGHQVNRRNPKADDYIFEARSGVNIINLEKTKEGLEAAAEYVKKLAAGNGSMVIVGTKRQAKGIVREEADRAKKEAPGKLYTITARWVGGTLTNFSEVSKNIKKLKTLTELLNTSKKEQYTKREQVMFEKERGRLESFYGGIQDMTEIPDAMFVVSVQADDIAVSEAIRLGCETVGIVDTNTDPSVINYPIPANDDAVGSIKLITSYLMDAWIEGRKLGVKAEEKEKAKAEKKEGDK